MITLKTLRDGLLSLIGVPVAEPGGGAPTNQEIATLALTLSKVRGQLERQGIAGRRLRPAIKALRRAQEILVRPPRLAITGEFNAGKSSLANVLIGDETLPTAVLSNTRIPTLLRHAARPSVKGVLATGRRQVLKGPSVDAMRDILSLEVGLPSPRLRDLDMIDVPGLSDPRLGNAGHRAVLFGADIIFWCTTSNQAWRESERLTWMGFPPRVRARGLLVVTRRDLLRNAADEASVLARLVREAGDLFRGIALVSSVRARAALAAGPDAGREAWVASGLADLAGALDQLVADSRNERITRVRHTLRRIAARALARLDEA